MFQEQSRRWGTGVALMAGVFGQASGQALQDVKSQTGAEMVYGPLGGFNNLNDGLVFLLKKVHGHYGAKPELGSFFRARTGEAVGTFFNVDDKNFSHQKQSGLVLVSKQSDGTVQAAVLTDRAAQFKGSINGMLRKVQAAWYGSGKSSSGPVQPLQTFTFPDNSGSIKLAQGWRPLIARSGGILALGPSGETMGVSCYLGVLDANSPQVRRSFASGRPLPGHYAAAPSNASPEEVFGILYNQLRQKHGMSQGRAQVSVVKRDQTQLGTTFTLAGEFDDNQTGPQNIIAVMSAGPVNPRLGGWSCMMTTVTAPKPLFSQERLTLLAMANSLNQNGAVIQRQSDAASQQIVAYGNRVRANTAAKGAAFDDYMKSIGAAHDNDDRRSAAFQDLQLDQSVVEQSATGRRGRFSNDDAYGLVQSNPDKYEIVPGSQYIKGRDF